MSGPSASGAAGGRNWRDLRVRLLSAILLAPAGLFCVWFGGWLFAALVAIGLIGLGAEWAGLLHRPLRSLRGAVLLAWPAIACAAALQTGRWAEASLMLLAPLALGFGVGAGTVSIGLAGLALVWLRFVTGPGWGGVLFVILVVWSSDSFAYLAGRLVGGARLAPRISPGKTWSGSIGGLLGAMLVGGALALALPVPPGTGTGAAFGRGVCVALLLGLVSQAGDLAESAFKRRCGVKDSGRLIPGHGGLLDRFDGLLAAAPVAALLSLAAPAGSGFWYVSNASAHLGRPSAPALSAPDASLPKE